MFKTELILIESQGQISVREMGGKLFLVEG